MSGCGGPHRLVWCSWGAVGVVDGGCHGATRKTKKKGKGVWVCGVVLCMAVPLQLVVLSVVLLHCSTAPHRCCGCVVFGGVFDQHFSC